MSKKNSSKYSEVRYCFEDLIKRNTMAQSNFFFYNQFSNDIFSIRMNKGLATSLENEKQLSKYSQVWFCFENLIKRNTIVQSKFNFDK